MDTGIKKYTVLPKGCLDMWVESVGIPKLPDDVCEVMVEDVTYRIREAVHNALRVMKHCKRTCLTVDDFNNALEESNTEPIYGHGGVDNLSFKAVTFKEGRVCYVDEKDVNLRETALESVYPTDPGETSLKASWLVLEGQPCSSGKSKDDNKTPLPEAISSYLTNITSALIDRSPHLRKVALQDLVENKKLQIAVPYLVTFFANQIKIHTSKESFSAIAIYLVQAIQSLVDNSSLLLTPYVFQLVKILLYIIIEAKIPVNDWSVKEKAALVLHCLCSKHTTTAYNLRVQLFKSYQESLNDTKRSLSCLYGTVVGIKTLGAEAIHRILSPVVKERLNLVEMKYEDAISPDEILEIITVKSVIADSISILASAASALKVENFSSLYTETYEGVGEEFLCRCLRFPHELAQSSAKSGLSAKAQATVAKKEPSTTALAINKELETLISTDLPMDVSSKTEQTSSSCLGNIVSTFSWKVNKIQPDVAVELFSMSTEQIDISERKNQKNKRKTIRLDRKKFATAHPAYSRKNKKSTKEQLEYISQHLPI